MAQPAAAEAFALPFRNSRHTGRPTSPLPPVMKCGRVMCIRSDDLEEAAHEMCEQLKATASSQVEGGAQ
jgi:hypothetical protein